ncbi:hypothetical protein BJF78_00625 [Pseudonocardia sp. CNS-139]|nr:hypothetical protein BJF78_00625 [Pseudonocardia sp. CNS-139]
MTSRTELSGQADSAPITRLDLGDVELAFLPDGVHHVEAHSQFPTTPRAIWHAHPEVFDRDGMLVMSVGSVLVRTPDEVVLVDLGFGPRTIDIADVTNGAHRGDLVGGRLLDSLAAVDLTPDRVDTVVFTHLHIDHVGWLGRPEDPARHTFERARYLVLRDEWNHWRRPERMALGTSVTEAQVALLSERIETPAGRHTVTSRVTLVPTPGHTPGHACVHVQGSTGRALILGDALHCPIELVHPGQTFVFDEHHGLAAGSRAAIDRILAEPATWFAGGHFPNRVFGRLRRTDGRRHIDWEA